MGRFRRQERNPRLLSRAQDRSHFFLIEVVQSREDRSDTLEPGRDLQGRHGFPQVRDARETFEFGRGGLVGLDVGQDYRGRLAKG